MLVRLDGNHFALIALLDEQQEYTSASFKRVYDGLNVKSFKTSQGFINIKTGISMVGLNAKALPLTPEQLINLATKNLPSSYVNGRIEVLRIQTPQQQ